jgi:hypothetical protein
MKKLPFERPDLKERYPCACAECQQIIYVAPSMMMSEFGENIGSGQCPKCQAYLHLEIDDANSAIVSELFDKYLERETSIIN